MSHMHQSWNPLVSNQLDMAIDQLILHLHILISLFLQMNGDVLCTRAWSYRIIILWSVFFCNCECDEFLLAKPMQSKQCNRQHCLSAGRARDRIKLSDIWEKEGSERKASKGDWKTRAFIHWWFIKRTGCQGRQWADIKELKGRAWGNDAAGGRKEMILLIKLSSYCISCHKGSGQCYLWRA